MCLLKHVDVTLTNVNSFEDILDLQAYHQTIAADLPKIRAHMAFKLEDTPSIYDFWGNQAIAIKGDSGKLFIAIGGTPDHWYITCGGPGPCNTCLDEDLDNRNVMSMKCNAAPRFARVIRKELMPFGNMKFLALT